MKLAEKNLHLPFSLSHTQNPTRPIVKSSARKSVNPFTIGAICAIGSIHPPLQALQSLQSLKTLHPPLGRYCLFPQQQPELQVVFFRQPLPIPPSHYTLALQWVLVCVRAVFFYAVVVHSVLIRAFPCPQTPLR